MTAAELAHLDAMTDDEIIAAALSDPDNPHLTDAEFAKMTSVRRVREVRARTGLSQARSRSRGLVLLSENLAILLG